jgi:hypothetical protein
MDTAEKIAVIETGKAKLDKRECFSKYNVKTEGAVTLTTEQAALIHAEFTPEGRVFFDKLYSALHLDIFGNVCKPNRLKKGMEKE